MRVPVLCDICVLVSDRSWGGLTPVVEHCRYIGWSE